MQNNVSFKYVFHVHYAFETRITKSPLARNQRHNDVAEAKTERKNKEVSK